LGSGAVIHALSGEQDITKMGGLRKKLPWTYRTFLFSTLAITGFPLLSGFFSKDEILWMALSSSSQVGGWVHLTAYLCGLVGAAITSFYMFRLVFLTFHGESRLPADVHVHKETWVMSVPLIILAGLAIVGGVVNMGPIGFHAFEHFLEPVVGDAREILTTPSAMSSGGWLWGGVAAAIAVFLIGWALARSLYLKNPEKPAQIAARAGGLYRLVFNKYFVDEIYDFLIIRPIHAFSVFLWKIFDDLIIDGLGVNGPAKVLRSLGGVGRRLQSGNAQAYAFWLFAGLAGALFYLLAVGVF
jgi:NADH-quinone oxidoreductase subunit L